MNLTQLNKLAKDFNIDPDKFGFYGEHDIVYLNFIEEIALPNYDSWEDDEAEKFADKYGIYWFSDCDSWGFYT